MILIIIPLVLGEFNYLVYDGHIYTDAIMPFHFSISAHKTKMGLAQFTYNIASQADHFDYPDLCQY